MKRTHAFLLGLLIAVSISVGAAVSGFPARAGSSLVLLDRQTASASTNIAFTVGIGSTYDSYVIDVSDMVIAGTNGLRIAVSEDGGSTWKNNAADYSMSFLSFTCNGSAVVGSTSGAAGQANLILTDSVVAANTMSGQIRFWAPSGTSRPKIFTWNLFRLSGGSGLNCDIYNGGGAYRGTNNAINAVRIETSVANNITTGTFSLYGVKKF